MKDYFKEIINNIREIRKYLSDSSSGSYPPFIMWDFIMMLLGILSLVLGLAGENQISMIIVGICLILSPVLSPIVISVIIIVFQIVATIILFPIFLLIEISKKNKDDSNN